MSNVGKESSQGSPKRWRVSHEQQGKSEPSPLNSLSKQEVFANNPHAYVVSEVISYAEKYRDSMIRTLVSRGHSLQDAEDAFQQGITNVLSKQEIKDSKGINKFITTSIVRAGIDMHRSDRKHMYTEDVMALIDDRGHHEPIDDEVITRSEVERVLLHFKDVKDTDQRVLLLKLYAMGYSAIELSKMFGMLPVTVRTRILRTNTKIRESLLKM